MPASLCLSLCSPDLMPRFITAQRARFGRAGIAIAARGTTRDREGENSGRGEGDNLRARAIFRLSPVRQQEGADVPG